MESMVCGICGGSDNPHVCHGPTHAFRPITVPAPISALEAELAVLLNQSSQENVSNTPDFILAAYLRACLAAFHEFVRQREAWYGRDPNKGPG